MQMRKVGADMNHVAKLKVDLPYVSKKKEESRTYSFTRYTIKKSEMKRVLGDSPETDKNVLRQATLSATVSPFLRAVMLIGESDSHYYLSVLESSEEKLNTVEIAGALINLDNDTLPIKEEGITFYIKPKSLTSLLSKEIKLLNLKNISLANIHHDYVRYFCGEGILEEVMVFHLLDNDFERLDQVIRKV